MKYRKSLLIVIVMTVLCTAAIVFMWYLFKASNQNPVIDYTGAVMRLDKVRRIDLDPLFDNLMRQDTTVESSYMSYTGEVDKGSIKEILPFVFLYRYLLWGVTDKNSVSYCKIQTCPSSWLQTNSLACSSFCDQFITSIHTDDRSVCEQAMNAIGNHDGYGKCDRLFVASLADAMQGWLEQRGNKQKRFSYAIRKRDRNVCESLSVNPTDIEAYLKRSFCIFAINKEIWGSTFGWK